MAENNEVATPPKKGRLKFILMLTVVLLLAIGLSVAGTLWFLKDGSGAGTGTSAGEAETEMFVPARYWVMEKPLVTTVKHPGRQRFVQLYLALESAQEEPLAAARKHRPLLRNALIAELGQSEFMALQTTEGREQLPDRLLAAVNQVLEQEGEPGVTRVLLRNFVVQ
ncbi:flagellar FliL protein [Marinobacter daqiaonensis]|uniref:Flagellar protein FliL n=1 Tax=Marinobacter daqiaonensis TaxID=650891 RepID=A0A1I6H6R7_9GAMM|nr:flagellar basal body-associated FliL family protein [Marinobacter daqiaonensis]SFR50084.1 flagellar FliL protein [Marinobacter daqiaonensis]